MEPESATTYPDYVRQSSGEQWFTSEESSEIYPLEILKGNTNDTPVCQHNGNDRSV